MEINLTGVDITDASFEFTLEAPLTAVSAELIGPDGSESVLVSVGEAVWDKTALDAVGFGWGEQFTVEFTMADASVREYDFQIIGRPEVSITTVLAGTPADVLGSGLDLNIDYANLESFVESNSNSERQLLFNFGTSAADSAFTLKIGSKGLFINSDTLTEGSLYTISSSLDSNGQVLIDLVDANNVYMPGALSLLNPDLIWNFVFGSMEAYRISFSAVNSGVISVGFTQGDGTLTAESYVDLNSAIESTLTEIASVFNGEADGNGELYIAHPIVSNTDTSLWLSKKICIYDTDKIAYGFKAEFGDASPYGMEFPLTFKHIQFVNDFGAGIHLRGQPLSLKVSSEETIEYEFFISPATPTISVWAYDSSGPAWVSLGTIASSGNLNATWDANYTAVAVLPMNGPISVIFATETLQMATTAGGGTFSNKTVVSIPDRLTALSLVDTDFTTATWTSSLLGEYHQFGAIWQNGTDVTLGLGAFTINVDSANISGLGTTTYTLTFTA